MTRRTFAQVMAGVATPEGRRLVGLALGSGGPFSAMPLDARADASRTVLPTKRCFLVKGKPTFLVSGAIDYFRCPHQLWRDRLLRAKRAGLNCIGTYVAWNFHEPADGVFDFEGDRDIGKFLGICHELGLYVFARVGPYIAGEWEAGGYPAWLLGKSGTELRTNNPATQPYIRRWFEQLIPHIASKQVTHGGPVVLVQAENEYAFCDRPDGAGYLRFLIHTLRGLGIEVPITDCNGLQNPLSESLKTLNGFDLEAICRYRRVYAETPVFLSEHYTGWLDVWGKPWVSSPSVSSLYQQTMELLANGVMYNLFMFHGGTSFGFWAGRTWNSDYSFLTTRYWSQAPIAEGGALHEKYFAAKSANLLASNFHDFFCQAESVPPPLKLEGPVRTLALGSSKGYLIFVLPQYPDRIHSLFGNDGRSPFFSEIHDAPSGEFSTQPAFLRLPSGRTVEMAESSSYPSMLPFQLKVDEGCEVDFANTTVLGYGGTRARRTIILRGEGGRRGIISVNGHGAEFVFPAIEPLHLMVGSTAVLALSQEMTDRTWFADGRVLIGPAYVGEEHNGQHDCWLDGRVNAIHTVFPEGQYESRKVSTTAIPLAEIRLMGWRAQVLPEIAGGGTGWREIGKPQSVEALGSCYGYSWYRASFDSEQNRPSKVLFTHASDRIHAFLNGKRIGVWGRGTGADRDTLPVELTKGRNNFVFLCDNMGRFCEGSKEEDLKGIVCEVYLDACERPLRGVDWSFVSGPPRNESWQFRTYRCISFTARGESRFYRSRFVTPVKPGDGALLALRWVPQFAWVYVNGQFVGEHKGGTSIVSGFSFSEFTLDPYLEDKEAVIDLTFFGEPMRDLTEHLRLFTYPRTSALREWEFKPWQNPSAFGAAQPKSPTMWKSEFSSPALPGPLFLVTQGLSKGQVFLNGSAVGRYWEIGPQHSLYLPEPWIQDRNQLGIFDEDGTRPDETYIMRDPRYPVRKILA